jgi:hypothetical protein
MPKSPKEAPIYVATHDMLYWLVHHLEGWPRPQRFFLARQTLDSATQFYRLLLQARKVEGRARAEALLAADTELETLKALLRLGQERRYMSLRQYEHISGRLLTIGQQLGGWRKSTESRLPGPGSMQTAGGR